MAFGRGLRAEVETLNLDPPARSGPAIIGAIETTCRELGVPYLSMVSRAYHDALFMARIAPTGMIFIPSINGISHAPQEFSRPQDIVNGANVLLLSVLQLDSQ